jgi:hypothetical protein
MAHAKTTTDHHEIKNWAEERGGRPARVKGTGSDEDPGMIRIDFTGEGSLEDIAWDDWFRKFDESNLALVFQETTAGGEKSNFNKLVGRETAAARARGEHGARRRKR